MRIKRNTAPARNVAVKSKAKKREAKKGEILSKYCNDICKGKGNLCVNTSPPNGISLLGCTSMLNVATTLNTLKVRTLSGKIGNWTASMVQNVFKEEYEQLKQSKTTELPTSGLDAQTGITW